jgi:AcrR family transcriptional regulator
MIPNDLHFINPEGVKIQLSTEVGKYFTADGSFDEVNFIAVVEEYVDFFKNMGSERDVFLEKAGVWLSDYITKVADYLKQKEMVEAALNLFKIAVDECVRLNISKFLVPAEYLKKIFSKFSEVSVKVGKKISINEKRRNIFNAALQVFGEEGYHKATVDKIAALSGIGKGSIYRYFNSKEELFEQLLIDEYTNISERISKIFSKDHDVLNQIEEVIEFWMGFIDDNPIIYHLIQSDDIVREKNSRVMFYEYISNHLPMLKERILALSEKRQIKITSFYTVFYGIFGFVDGVVHKWVRSGMKYSLRKEIPIVKEVVFNGFVGDKVDKKVFYVLPEKKTGNA